MKCPKCKTSLRARQCDHITIDVCPICRGMWLEAGELEELLAAGWAEKEVDAIEPTPAEVDLLRATCPFCEGNGKLVKIRPPEYPHILMDMCKVCHGIWLDASELGQMRNISKSNTTGLLGLLMSLWGLTNQ